MISPIFKKRILPSRARAVMGIGAVAILAVLVFAAIGSVQAAGTEPHQTISPGDRGNARILLAANDAHAAEKMMEKLTDA